MEENKGNEVLEQNVEETAKTDNSKAEDGIIEKLKKILNFSNDEEK